MWPKETRDSERNKETRKTLRGMKVKVDGKEQSVKWDTKKARERKAEVQNMVKKIEQNKNNREM